MDIIPVIDLKGGCVVRAKAGRRDEYLPIVTPLAASSDPIEVARGLLALFPFRSLYIADLDAIEGKGDNAGAIAGLCAAFPGCEIWLDNGLSRLADARTWLAQGLGRLVIGSESQSDAALLAATASDRRVALSLDFRGDAFLGPSAILDDPALWPQRVIVMTLARVGGDGGPDVARLAALRVLAPNRQFFAAGGVRDFADVAALAKAGAAGALASTSLHDGRLSAGDLARAEALAR